MSQKPSSVDLRVSDFKRVPGFNYVLSVSAEDERVVRVLVLRRHRQHIVEAGNPLEVGDARRSTDEGFWLLNIFIR